MGLSDIVRGMRNGPRGERTRGSGSGWGSKLMAVALGLFAYKMFKGRDQQPEREPDEPPPRRRWL
ncbi:hypothetical protein [Blastochloris viridis]|uniref:Uncharacterized protein n=1 Tax=Blastochloris viridis TaxID=1079 RepID=A0A0H5B7T0_BLAVI|nr:hypothetical protein [Blastochloris viridis]ALK08481.1 hypothetical protein BVIR_687 [Blastochloris viridis]BAR98235.1 hypothetical protein BV133_642 [Blastochloris viridis]CUU41143.1 hypothetical protein BVIRIDIS_01310 [Blastochloris viridis]